MIIRALTPLRTGLLAAALLATTCCALPRAALAANPYERTDDCEGDPGDGVLDPRAASGGGGDAHQPDVVDLAGDGAGPQTVDTPGVVPVIIPDRGGRVVILILPGNWWQPWSRVPDLGGRWHDAP